MSLSVRRPKHRLHRASWHGDAAHRPQLSKRCKSVARSLELQCERVAAPPAALYKLFTRYDADGSGKIAYDELIDMVKDTGTSVPGGAFGASHQCFVRNVLASACRVCVFN